MTQCPICLDNTSSKGACVLRCGHSMHISCLAKLAKSQLMVQETTFKCPLCRSSNEIKAEIKGENNYLFIDVKGNLRFHICELHASSSRAFWCRSQRYYPDFENSSQCS